MRHAALATRLPVLAAMLLLANPVAAFGSMPPSESPHDLVTAQGARNLGFSDDLLKALQEAVRRPDLDEAKISKPGGPHLVILDAAADYSPAHHCDRIPPMPHDDVLPHTISYIHEARRDALVWIRSGHEERTVRALGNALHALQDCFSHSDIVDKDRETQQEYMLAIVHGRQGPTGIRFTGLQPGADEAEFPPGDLYPHGDFAKDGDNFTTDAGALLPDGRTKYQAARSLAETATYMFLREFLENLTAPQKDLLWSAKGDLSPKQLPLPVALVLPTLAAVAVRLRGKAA